MNFLDLVRMASLKVSLDHGDHLLRPLSTFSSLGFCMEVNSCASEQSAINRKRHSGLTAASDYMHFTHVLCWILSFQRICTILAPLIISLDLGHLGSSFSLWDALAETLLHFCELVYRFDVHPQNEYGKSDLLSQLKDLWVFSSLICLSSSCAWRLNRAQEAALHILFLGRGQDCSIALPFTFCLLFCTYWYSDLQLLGIMKVLAILIFRLVYYMVPDESSLFQHVIGRAILTFCLLDSVVMLSICNLRLRFLHMPFSTEEPGSLAFCHFVKMAWTVKIYLNQDLARVLFVNDQCQATKDMFLLTHGFCRTTNAGASSSS